MISGNYPCVRASKITAALRALGHPHSAIALKAPPQLPEVYHLLDVNRWQSADEMGRRIAEHPARVVHFHNEPHWPLPVAAANANGRPVIFNVHDVARARRGEASDQWEDQAYRDADAFIFVSEEQREYALEVGLEVGDRPYITVPCYALRETFVTDSPYPRVGGVVYAGGCHPRSGGRYWRDLSPISDALGGELHLFPGQVKKPGYGILHQPEWDYRRLIHRLSAFDWAFAGVPHAHHGYEHAIPNKPFDAFAAGIPVIAMNVPLLRPILERGLGIYCESYAEVREAARTDPTPFKARVLELRDEYTMDRLAPEIIRLYRVALGEACPECGGRKGRDFDDGAALIWDPCDTCGGIGRAI